MPPKNIGRKATGTKRARSPDAKADEVAVTSNISGTPAAIAPEPTAKRAKSTKSPATPATPSIAATVAEAAPADVGKSKDINKGKEINEALAFVDPETMFLGKFDLYGMDLPFLNSEYTAKPGGKVNPEALYRSILKYQAKDDRTIEITIPDDYKTNGEGDLSSAVFCEPLDDEPYEISISLIRNHEELIYTSKYGRPDDAWSGPSIQGALSITNEGCGISSSSGKIKMQPLWKKLDDEGHLMELFEGIVSFSVAYGAMYRRKGFGSGENHSISFWAVRAGDE